MGGARGGGALRLCAGEAQGSGAPVPARQRHSREARGGTAEGARPGHPVPGPSLLHFHALSTCPNLDQARRADRRLHALLSMALAPIFPGNRGQGAPCPPGHTHSDTRPQPQCPRSCPRPSRRPCWTSLSSPPLSQQTSRPGGKRPGLSTVTPVQGGQKIWTDVCQRHTDGQQTHEKMLDITHRQANANQNHSEMSPRTCHDGIRKKDIDKHAPARMRSTASLVRCRGRRPAQPLRKPGGGSPKMTNGSALRPGSPSAAPHVHRSTFVQPGRGNRPSAPQRVDA